MRENDKIELLFASSTMFYVLLGARALQGIGTALTAIIRIKRGDYSRYEITRIATARFACRTPFSDQCDWNRVSCSMYRFLRF